MSEHRLKKLLDQMPAMAEVVNAQHSEADQLRVFEALLAAFDHQVEMPSIPPVGERLRNSRNDRFQSVGAVSLTDAQMVRQAINEQFAEYAAAPLPSGYSQEISRKHKALYVFLLDQSLSMDQPLGKTGRRKMDELALAINGWLLNMCIRCTRSDGVWDYCDVAVFRYSTDLSDTPILESPFCGVLGDQTMCSIVEVGENPHRLVRETVSFYDEDSGQTMETEREYPVWIEPQIEGLCPLCRVLSKTYDVVSQWILEHPTSFPPLIFNISDGEIDDGDPLPYAAALKELGTEDGNVLVFNLILSAYDGDPVLYPSSEGALPDDASRKMFRMSSPIPETLRAVFADDPSTLQSGARLLGLNVDMGALVRCLDGNTRVAKNLR